MKTYSHMDRENERNQKILEAAQWYVDNKSTVRGVAANFMISKSCVWRLFNDDLRYLDYDLYEEVMVVMKNNKQHRIERMTIASAISRRK